jgi:hypothetical protein
MSSSVNPRRRARPFEQLELQLTELEEDASDAEAQAQMAAERAQV